MDKREEMKREEFGIDVIRVAMRLQNEDEGWRLQQMNARMLHQLCQSWLSSSKGL